MLLQVLRGKTFEHYDMVKDLISDSAARGQYIHRGTTQSVATTTSLTPDEQESADSLGSIISEVTPLSASGSGGLAAMVASASGTFTQILSNPELDNTSLTSESHPSAHCTTSPMQIDMLSSSSPPPSVHNSRSAPPSFSAGGSGSEPVPFIHNSGLTRPPSIDNSGSALPSHSRSVSAVSNVSSGQRKRKRKQVETENIKSSASHRSKRNQDSKPTGALAAFVGMTGAVSSLTTSLNQSSSLSDTAIVQQATSLISNKANYFSKSDKGLLFQYYARNPTAAAGLLALNDADLEISLS